MKHVCSQCYLTIPLRCHRVRVVHLVMKYNDIAPGENRHPTSIMTDKKCEPLAFPVSWGFSGLVVRPLTFHL